MRTPIPLSLVIVLLLSACASTAAIEPAQTAIPLETPRISAEMIPPTSIPASTAISVSPLPVPDPNEAWIVFTSDQYGFSLQTPALLPVNVIDPTLIMIGDRIRVIIWDGVDHGLGEGAAPVSSMDVQIAGQSAARIDGYHGSIGGYVPQNFISYKFTRGTATLYFTLYAYGFETVDTPPSDVVALNPEDIALFDQIMASLQFR